MVRPNSANPQPASLFRMIKVPVARHHHDGSFKPNPTIAKKLGGYHRRLMEQDQTKRSSLIGMIKSAVRKMKNAFRLPASPLIRRIQELEDDIRLLRQKNEILEKGYTIETHPLEGGRHDAHSQESTKAQQDESEATVTAVAEGVATPDHVLNVYDQPGSPNSSQTVDGREGLRIPAAPPAPPLAPSQSSIPVAPPAPPIGASIAAAPGSACSGRQPPLPNRHVSSTRQAAAPTSLENSALRSCGISIDDLRSVQLRPVVQPLNQPPPPPKESAFRVSVEDLFSVPLKPVARRKRLPARRRDDDSDNDEFRILRAAMKQRVQALYSPSMSAAASDAEWNASPGFRSPPTATAGPAGLNTSIPT